MAIVCKFKSAKESFDIPIEGAFVSVRELKNKIVESKHLNYGKDWGVALANAQTNEDYDDEAALIPRYTAVIVCRLPGPRRMPIVVPSPMVVENELEGRSPSTTADAVVASMKLPEDLAWQSQVEVAHGHGRGYKHDVEGQLMANHGFGRLETPPESYVCHRCGVAGHFIYHCPTNGNPEFNNKRFGPQFGNSKPMLVSTSNASCVPQSRGNSVRPNDATYLKECGGLSSSCAVSGLPPELHCPLCKEVMKDAVFTSNCCFNSFCDKCIREHIISKSMCMCGLTNILADSLVPNRTLRDTINRMLESASRSSGNTKSVVQDPSSVSHEQQAPPTITLPVSSEDEKRVMHIEDAPDVEEKDNDSIADVVIHNLEDAVKRSDVSEATAEHVNVKETTSKENTAMTQQIRGMVVDAEQGEKKKKNGGKKIIAPGNAGMQCSYSARPFEPLSHYQYWGNDALPWEMNHFVQALSGATPYLDYQQFQPQYSFGAEGYKLPYLPQRDVSELPISKKAINQELPINRADKVKIVVPRRDELREQGPSSAVQTERDYFSQKRARMERQGLAGESTQHSTRHSPQGSRQINRRSNHSAHPSSDHADVHGQRKSSTRSHIEFTDSERSNWSNKKRKSQTR